MRMKALMKDPSKGDLNRGTRCVQALHGTVRVCAHEGSDWIPCVSDWIPCVSVDPLTPSSTVRTVNEAAELWVGGWEISSRFVKDRARRRGNMSEEVSGLFIASESTSKLVGKGQMSMSRVKDRDRRRGDMAVTVSDRSRSSRLRSKLEEEMQAVTLVLVSDEPLV